MSDPEFFDPFIDLIRNHESVLRKTGLKSFALHTCACARACAAHTGMTRSPSIQFNKRKERVMWDNKGWVRNGTKFCAVVGVTHG